MRWTSLATAAAMAFALAPMMTPAAHADPYPWCAIYTGRDGGATNCGFVTLRQCRATVSGIGGFCDRNPRYNGRPFTNGYGGHWRHYRHYYHYRR